MFTNTNVFNSDLSWWRFNVVTSMDRMFENAIEFDTDCHYWCVSYFKSGWNKPGTPQNFSTGAARFTSNKPRWGELCGSPKPGSPPPLTPAPDPNPIYKLVVGSTVEALDTPTGGYDGNATVWFSMAPPNVDDTFSCRFVGAHDFQLATIKALELKNYEIAGNTNVLIPSKYEVIDGGDGFPSPATKIEIKFTVYGTTVYTILEGVSWPVELY